MSPGNPNVSMTPSAPVTSTPTSGGPDTSTAPNPTTITATAPVAVAGTPTEPLWEVIVHDFFELGMGAVAIFIKNGTHLQTAANVIAVLKTVFPNL